MKKLALSLAILFSFFTSEALAAGIPVVDAPALSQDALHYAKELMEMANQLNTMKDQLAQQIKTYESMVGDRGMGTLLDNEVRNYLPESWQSSIDFLDNPGKFKILAEKMKKYMEEMAVISEEEATVLSEDTQKMVKQQRAMAAKFRAYSETAYQTNSERFKMLETMQRTISVAKDPKAIMDLQARIDAEQNHLAAESAKLTAMAQAFLAEEMAFRQRARERNAKSGGYSIKKNARQSQ